MLLKISSLSRPRERGGAHRLKCWRTGSLYLYLTPHGRVPTLPPLLYLRTLSVPRRKIQTSYNVAITFVIFSLLRHNDPAFLFINSHNRRRNRRSSPSPATAKRRLPKHHHLRLVTLPSAPSARESTSNPPPSSSCAT